MDLAAGAAGAGIGHLPEVILAPEGQNLLGDDTGLVLPGCFGFFISGHLPFFILEICRPQA
jgi:hypothetical protein